MTKCKVLSTSSARNCSVVRYNRGEDVICQTPWRIMYLIASIYITGFIMFVIQKSATLRSTILLLVDAITIEGWMDGFSEQIKCSNNIKFVSN
ncbi:hypothetical protein LguiA_026747 [Lonicera macranthoides]